MNLEQLMARYLRLKRKLSAPNTMQPWHSGRMDCLADALAATEREIAALQRRDTRPPQAMTASR